MSFLSKLFDKLFGEKQSRGTEDISTSLTARSWRELADRSDEQARRLNIDPPRPGRKTYAERYNETRRMPTSEIKALIARREAEGKECGVAYRVLADRGE
ncbi:MAG: hypothetical protein CV087_22505 [Candidatus Brocadia sp. WS118]|nr:MAG: hypothetical protein CV087_22505 [Candidatus Brocadia sp. WS118]